MPEPYALPWFRRDLRIAGNPALQHVWKKYNGRVAGIFCFDSEFLDREDFSANRFGFFLKTLEALRDELRAFGSDLLVVDSLPRNAFPKLLQHLRENRPGLAELSFNRDYEPFARARDADIAGLMQKEGIALYSERDHLVVEPQELAKNDEGGYYQVYSPFAKKWFQVFSGPEFQDRVDDKRVGFQHLERVARGEFDSQLFKLTWKELRGPGFPFEDSLALFADKNTPRMTIALPKAGSQAAYARLKSFKQSIENYGERRDLPATDGTSQLSIYFKNGSLTPAQAISHLNLKGLDLKGQNGATKFLKEIVWREFYYHILHHEPRVEKEAFLSRYKNIRWENNKSHFEAWCVGETGYPIVDAGMRQLNATGWMHNRVRMVVASFLVKDLLVDWRWGENYFMKKLLDGDLAPNNGGWQWAASTGCDPQPYFRIFNPWLQSAKFDPEGEYIRRYVPELGQASAAAIHDPDPADRPAKYVRPIVDHFEQKPKALALFKGAE